MMRTPEDDFVSIPEIEGRFADRAPDPRAAARRFPLVAFEQIRLSGGASYLVKGLIPRTGVVIIWGPPKCGKSFFTFDMVMHVALGWEYRGRRVKAGPVVYCALEGAEGFKARKEAFRLEKMGALTAAPFHLMAASLNLVADQAAFLKSIGAQLGDAKPVAVVIDTLNRSLNGSENDDEDMRKYMAAADAIRDAFDCAVLIVHHCGHGGDRPRGHSLLGGALDMQIAVKRDAADNVVATLELAKDSATGDEIISKLLNVEVGTDEDGDPITSCIIAQVETAARPAARAKEPRLTPAAKIALRALRDAVAESGATPPASSHIPQGVKTVALARWREHA